MDIFEFFVEGPPLSQQTRNQARLREWKEYVRSEAAKLWDADEPYRGALKLTVVYYHERQSVLIDHDNMIKPIQDSLAGLVYRNDRQITDAQTRKPMLMVASESATFHRYMVVPSLAAKSLSISE